MSKKELVIRGQTVKSWKGLKLEAWSSISRFSKIKVSRGSKAVVYLDKNGTPKVFAFDTFALLDILSAIDEPLLDKLSDEEYHSAKTNPAGWMIDKIESRMPVHPKFAQSLKNAVREAGCKGWVPLSKLCADLGLT